MKLLFKNRTQYTKKAYQTYLEFHQKKYGTTYRFYTICITLLIFFCLAMQIKFHYYGLSIFLMIALTCFLLWRFFHPIAEIKKEWHSNKIQKEKEFSFRFYEKYFQIVDTINTSKMSYWKLKHVFETDHFFYLYLDKNHAFLLAKEGFVIGNEKDFSTFIKRKCRLIYRKINQN